MVKRQKALEIITSRVEPKVKQAIEKAAADDRRSVSTLVETVLVEWLKTKGYLK